MIEWTPEAEDFLIGYLQQVGALARHQGDDAEEIVGGLREHIARETEADAGTLVTLEHLQKALATVGTPEQVTSVDSPFAARAMADGVVPRPPVARAVVPVAKPRSRWPWLIPLWMVVVIPFSIFLLVVALMLAAIFLPALSRARESARRAACQGNLKQMALVLDRFAEENDGVYPPLSTEAGRWMFDADQVSPRFLVDPVVLLCPTDENTLAALRQHDSDDHIANDTSYFYLGYAVRSEQGLDDFADAWMQTMESDNDFTKDLVEPGGRTVRRLSKRIQEPSEVPVLIERANNHMPDGGNVLYLDGHVKFVKMGSFPMIQEFLDALESFER